MHTLISRIGGMVAAAVLVAVFVATPAGAQSVTAADIQRLQDHIYDASADLSRLRSRDASQADRLQADLDTLREEVIYLKVKLRKDETVARPEYSHLRDRIEALRSQARGEAPAAETTRSDAPKAPATGTTTSGATTSGTAAGTTGATGRETGRTTSAPLNEVPVGTELDVRLQTRLSSDNAQVEDRFTATTMVDLKSDNRVLIPAGSVVRGVVTGVDKAGRVERRGRLVLNFDQLTVNGRSYPINATVTEAIESEGIRGEVGKIGAGAGVGAIIGGILGGFKGALAGILIGAGGTVAATEGKDVELPAGTVLRLRFDSPVTIR